MSYDTLAGIRRSDLWHIRQTPMHFRWHIDHPEEPTPALIFGQAAHKYILEPGTFFDEFSVMPGNIDRRTRDGKEAWRHFQALSGDRTIINEADMQAILTMRAAIMANEDAKEILTADGLQTEKIYQWKDPETGELCKVKADIVVTLDGTPMIVDYKTTTSCEDGAFERSCRKYGYDFQAGMYTEGIDIMTMERHTFAFIAQEKTEPYACRVYYCDPDFVQHGKRIYHDLLRKYHECKEREEWPGYQSTDLYAEDI